jgi:hypothetical protein
LCSVVILLPKDVARAVETDHNCTRREWSKGHGVSDNDVTTVGGLLYRGRLWVTPLKARKDLKQVMPFVKKRYEEIASTKPKAQ